MAALALDEAFAEPNQLGRHNGKDYARVQVPWDHDGLTTSQH